MTILFLITAVLAGLIHVLFFCLESLWWMQPKIRERFNQTELEAETTKLMAFNQGFYNLFLAAGIFIGLVLYALGYNALGLLLVGWNAACMLGAGVVLWSSAPEMRRGAVIQGVPPLLCLVAIGLICTG